MSKKILVLYGGLSSERTVSQRSGKAIANGLRKVGFTVKEFDFKGRMENVIDQFMPDVVFIALHGKFGEDGTVQGVLELLGVPYTGSGVLASSVCMDKFFTKMMFKEMSIPTPNFLSFEKSDLSEIPDFSDILRLLNARKVVIKPVDQGSTIGITIASTEEKFKEGINIAFFFSNRIIIEKFIEGKEITASVIGNGGSLKVLPIIEIVPENEFYDFESKYTPGMSHHIIPARISKKSYSEAEKMAIRIYNAFELRDFARIDFIVNDRGDVFALEVNTIPGFTETSLLPDAAKAAGIDFPNLVRFIVNEAIKRAK